MHHPFLLLLLILILTPPAFALISVLAVVPYFLLGALGYLWLTLEGQKEKRGGTPALGLSVPESEAELWHQEQRSLATYLESPAEAVRRAS